ncbi:MAG: branched-chain amino acid transaminase [Chloroflexi bacterium]|nr:branched-chain amino acid transaminase [Chloroflexota bacterium]
MDRPQPYAYFQKNVVPLAEAKLSIMTHALHYGTACFEGIRGNWNPEEGQAYLFRAPEHFERLHRSCRILKISLPYSVDELARLIVEVVAKSGFQEDVYVRPLAYKSQQYVGVRLHNLEDDFLMFVTPFGAYLDLSRGINCCVSSWRRPEDTMIPARAKVTGIYVNSALAKTEAMDNGFDEAVMLTMGGHVSEGSGENLFLVVNGKLVTPPSSDCILMGITRDTVMTLAKEELGIETEERSIGRAELYTAEECFLTGTAAHITSVATIDHRPVGSGGIGLITKKLQDLYFDVVRGKVRKYMRWCTPVYAKALKVKA